MTDRPILFSGPMVRALLDGSKTQTRRILKPQPQGDVINYGWQRGEGAYWTDQSFASHKLPIWAGYRLWVKETWRAHAWHGDCVEIAYAAQRGLVGWTEQHCQIPYPKGDKNAFKFYAPKGPDFWRPSLFMPRWASRITLLVTDVKVERLQEIDLRDARAEGCVIRQIDLFGAEGEQRDAIGRAYYRQVWEDINGAGSWNSNPWVVAYTFRVIKQNIDQIEKVAA